MTASPSVVGSHSIQFRILLEECYDSGLGVSGFNCTARGPGLVEKAD